ncbi:hypothetical protein F1559_000384 [Cyanidiococcus yangmingshanensis]|uniref:50S ribosomal protein L18 n=1 Tax=Cyanidiococcus yangmingshanensis TaxID=2690220 RepID=A0A7J7IC93_9RHOD|nr:hypothetical protein F1559_000384 [Cyanidiococcus yangmingshanensis]
MRVSCKSLLGRQVRGFAKRIRHRELPPQRIVLTLTSKHIKAQVINQSSGNVEAEASTLQKEVREGTALETTDDAEATPAPSPLTELVGYQTASVEAARRVGVILGRRARAAGVRQVQWTSPGRFHGKIRAFYEAFRSSGIEMK